MTTLISLEVGFACSHLILSIPSIWRQHQPKNKIYFTIMQNHRNRCDQTANAQKSRNPFRFASHFFIYFLKNSAMFAIFGSIWAFNASLNSSNVLMYVLCVSIRTRGRPFSFVMSKEEQHAHQSINHPSERYYDSCNLFDWIYQFFLLFRLVRWIKSNAFISIEARIPYVLHSRCAPTKYSSSHCLAFGLRLHVLLQMID